MSNDYVASVALNTGLNLGVAQSFSVAATAVAMANSISLVMENAVISEKSSQAMQNASVAQCCVLMIAAGAAGAATAG